MRSFERLSLRFCRHQEPVRVSLLTGLWPFMSSQLTTSDAPKKAHREAFRPHIQSVLFSHQSTLCELFKQPPPNALALSI
jgi:hypothetical protein